MVTVEAPAKLNLHLQVLGRMDSGFHEILSVFQAISLADRLELRSLKAERGIELHGSFECPPHENTIVRVAKAWLSEAGLDAGVEIRVDKRVPSGAGLGGGSSDAAATLRGLETLFGVSLGEERLLALAAAVGSDVPFFLGSPRALVSGRGEVLRALTADPAYPCVVVSPGFPIATRLAFRLLDEARAERRAAIEPNPSAESLIVALELEPASWPFGNDFLEVLAPTHPGLAATIQAIAATGASYAGLSGSGSACFGVFESELLADNAARSLSESGLSTFRCAMLARHSRAAYTQPEDSKLGQGVQHGDYRHPHPQDQRRGKAQGVRDGNLR